jgi:hypothetical protein
MPSAEHLGLATCGIRFTFGGLRALTAARAVEEDALSQELSTGLLTGHVAGTRSALGARRPSAGAAS